MESISLSKFDRLSNFSVLVNNVREKLNGMKYLLVLDDLWNEDQEQWETLKSVLLVGAHGSKILITTRKDQVASIVRGSLPPYNLEQIPEDVCWSIIEQQAFSPGGALNSVEMTNIGKEIAKKCCGLPLAAKFLGGLLHSKNKESDWISIRNDDIWNTSESQSRILPVLKLSYNNLPSHWMAEGFIKLSNVGNVRSIEDFGNEYFESLAWSSFFHNFKKNELGDIETCKMHDLVHDLAQDVFRGNELVSLKVVTELNNVSEVRRLKLVENLSVTLLESLSIAKKLRTIFVPEGSNLDPALFLGNKHLRVLHVGRSPNLVFPKLSHLSFKLKHLRYLHLTSIDLRELVNDQSINKLYNLETLVLNNIYGVQNLLTNIQSLQKLRYLEISFTEMEELPDSVTSLCNLQTLDLHNSNIKSLPASITRLKHLRFLDLSVNHIESLPDCITSLHHLQTLNVDRCSKLKALPENVTGLDNLRIFNFKNCPLLEALPSDFGALSQLKYLNLEGTAVKVLPESCTNLSKLEHMHLFRCEVPKDVKYWTQLTKFYYYKMGTPMGIGKLVRLRQLTYAVGEKVTNKGIEVLGNLNSLEVLCILDLRKVYDPIDAERANLLGKQDLRALELFWGNKRTLSTWDQKSPHFQVFEALQPPSTSLRCLKIDGFMGCDLPSWLCVPSCFPNLEQLILVDCKGIKYLPAAIEQLPRLRRLLLTGMPLKTLDIGGFPFLDAVGLTDMSALKELCCSHSSIKHLNITGCKNLVEIPSFPCLKDLVLRKLNHKVVSSVWRSQASLTFILLDGIEELIFFPVSILQNNCNLQILQIEKCNHFKGFRVDDDENENEAALLGSEIHLGSLRELNLADCPVLKFLPDLRRVTSLRKFIIFQCPQVKESLTYDLRSLSFLKRLHVDFIQRDEQRGNPSSTNELINLMRNRI